ncbi:putative methyltransferase type 11 protein [Escherichia phage JLBYU41]|uniref:Methyltransferase type 11 protein n=1 Tax=Escherichia phage JLBYU41 TaxID=2894750 RepID=A0AAE9CFS8_9CAUD|nr:putative AbrB family transcriptional regulator-like protein [Escherichia phage JLBYU09]UGO55913.1 putative methyltransferase type 11 protein [Escherichia phage JLBYU41]
MKIKIIDVNNAISGDELTLEECGIEVGDVFEVTGQYRDGTLSIQAPRDTDDGCIKAGDELSVNEGEYEVVEE